MELQDKVFESKFTVFENIGLGQTNAIIEFLTPNRKKALIDYASEVLRETDSRTLELVITDGKIRLIRKKFRQSNKELFREIVKLINLCKVIDEHSETA